MDEFRSKILPALSLFSKAEMGSRASLRTTCASINRGEFKRVEHLVHDDSRFNDLAKVGVLVVLVCNQHLGDSGRRVHAQLRHGPKNSVRVEHVVLEDDDVRIPQALIEKTSST
jgi:hypothetical protein